MPAPIPSGYTRGPILFIGPCRTQQAEDQLLQHFWEEAGAYGARIVLVSVDHESDSAIERYVRLFEEWESDSVETLAVADRQAALALAQTDLISAGTAIVLLGENPVRLATVLGGTPLAQAIRRANARGKAVCGIGRAAALLCEHMIAFDTQDLEAPQPFLRRHLIQFAPGLGITNRVVLDTSPAEPGDGWNRLARLLHAVSYNPFLVGVGLEWDTGMTIYPDNTLEVFGRNSALIVDGAAVTYSDIHDYRRTTPLSLIGTQVHVLGPAFTFSLTERKGEPPAQSDIPLQAVPENAQLQQVDEESI